MISVCIATYNGEKYILKQLESIIQQLNIDDEVIISDDSSTDNTLRIIESLNDKRIKIYPNQKFRNPIFNFENAINKAQGDLIFLSDQDDLWMPGKVQHVKKALEKFDMVVTDHSVINEANEKILDSYFAKVPSGPGLIKNIIKNSHYGCCMAFKREILSVALPFPKDIPMHDIWLGFVSDLYFKTCFINYPYTQYRKHNANASNATEIKSENSILKKIKYRIDILKYLPYLIIKSRNIK